MLAMNVSGKIVAKPMPVHALGRADQAAEQMPTQIMAKAKATIRP